MSDRRKDDPAIDTTPETGAPSADSQNSQDVAQPGFAERYSQTAFGRGMDAAGVGLALRALEEGGNSRSPEGEMSFVRKEMERRAAKQERGKDDKGSAI